MPRYRFAVDSPLGLLRLLLTLFIIYVTYGSSVSLWAQGDPTWRAGEGLLVGSEAERYLRVLQLAEKAPLYVWTMRGIAPHEVPALLPVSTDHPWRDRMDFTAGRPGGLEFGWVRPKAEFLSNSAYPFGENDGAMWAGRGLTAVAGVGGFLSFGLLHIRLAPEGFWTENGNFDLADNGESGEAVYWDERRPAAIDQPQRFGDQGYRRLSLGSSALHVKLPGVTLGVSGAGQQWGPALHYPLLLGNNAGGFLHIFGQTSGPVDLWALRLQGRYLLGWPNQSDFSPVGTDAGRQIVTGATVVMVPRGIDGLELGLARFIHNLYPDGSFQGRDILRVFTGVTYDFMSDRNKPLENQMASLFFRWVFPGAGVEVYGELIKEDFQRDLRHTIEEPDDLMGRVFGFQKVWQRSGEGLAVLRGEMVNAQVHHSERFGRLRLWDAAGITGGGGPITLYMHHSGVVYHTHLGQILGSPTAYGGAGWTLGMDFFDESGRWTVDLFRALQSEFSQIHTGTTGPEISDVIYGLKLEGMQFRNGVEWTVALTPSLNLNRNLVEDNDVFNLAVRFSIRGFPW